MEEYFCQLLNVHVVNEVKQTEIHTAKPLVPELDLLMLKLLLKKVKWYKSPGTDQILA
jgi:hypothetical protein